MIAWLALAWALVWRIWLVVFSICFLFDWSHAYAGKRLGREGHIAAALQHGIPARTVESFVDSRGRMTALWIMLTVGRPLLTVGEVVAVLGAFLVALVRWCAALVLWLLAVSAVLYLLRGAYFGIFYPIARWRGLRAYVGRRWRL